MNQAAELLRVPVAKARLTAASQGKAPSQAARLPACMVPGVIVSNELRHLSLDGYQCSSSNWGRRRYTAGDAVMVLGRQDCGVEGPHGELLVVRVKGAGIGGGYGLPVAVRPEDIAIGFPTNQCQAVGAIVRTFTRARKVDGNQCSTTYWPEFRWEVGQTVQVLGRQRCRQRNNEIILIRFPDRGGDVFGVHPEDLAFVH